MDGVPDIMRKLRPRSFSDYCEARSSTNAFENADFLPDELMRKELIEAGRDFYQRWNAGWPSFTATNVPRQVAQTFPFALKLPSTVARSLVDSITLADTKTGLSAGVGRNNLIA